MKPYISEKVKKQFEDTFYGQGDVSPMHWSTMDLEQNPILMNRIN